jgi:hypothetical protein
MQVTEFFSLDTVFLKRLNVLLYMELEMRRVIWFAVTNNPDSAWVSQQGRTWFGRRVKARLLIHDHDAKFGGRSDLVLQAEGMRVIRTPIAAPTANAHMERQIVTRTAATARTNLWPDSWPAPIRS